MPVTPKHNFLYLLFKSFYQKSAVVLIITFITSGLLLFSLSYISTGSLSMDSFLDFLSGNSPVVDAQANESDENEFGIEDPTPLTNRYSDSQAPFSIFATCVEEVQSWGEYRILFGYENRTEETIVLNTSQLPYGR